jgi:hypothetical protein
MAAELRRHNALVCERVAIRALCGCGYRLGDVAVLASEALHEARKAIIAETDPLGQILTSVRR